MRKSQLKGFLLTLLFGPIEFVLLQCASSARVTGSCGNRWRKQPGIRGALLATFSCHQCLYRQEA